jgi:hypothetical protein
LRRSSSDFPDRFPDFPNDPDASMCESTVTDDQLAAYLQEQLPLADLVAVENTLRESEPLRRRAARLAMRRDLGGHSVGAIWRTERLSCPDREELGAYLLGTLSDGRADYVSFHLRTLGCRYCAANLVDLRTASTAAPPATARRQRYFESSAGLVRRTDRGR